VKNRSFVSLVRWISLGLVFSAVMLALFQLVSFSRIRTIYPVGMVIAGIPVGGLDNQLAANRLIQAYSLPVELHLDESVIQVRPAVAGFELDIESMLAVAELQRSQKQFWSGFWDYLWNKQTDVIDVPLRATISQERLRQYLRDEIASRYDRTPTESIPIPGTTMYQAGQPGLTLDIDRAVVLISDALKSPTSRVVSLTYNRTNPARPSFQNLRISLQQILQVAGFGGVAEIYLLDLQTGQEISFAYQKGVNLPTGISFTAASTVKIPIMTSVFRRIKEPAPKDVTDLIELMIERSENDPADTLMEKIIDKNLGPLEITNDLIKLGLPNSFLAGMFYPGAPLLKRFQTTANSRRDINTGPDPYNQTTPAELGMLLEDIYLCAETNGGSFPIVFPGEISQAECRLMISYLARNKIAVLFESGLPEGTQIAHKHGWITESDGLLHTIADAGIIYTPGGNYILVGFLNNNQQLLFDPANALMGQISSAVYNYYNQTIK
jgi:beta-lactamase class A